MVFVNIAIPVFNEKKELKNNTLKLYEFLKKNADFKWEITIADNASTDNSPVIGMNLAKKYKEINYLRLDKKGRGRAVIKAWNNSQANILAYMDIDLSTDIKHLPNLVKALQNGADLAVGSRLLKQSRVEKRSYKREFISRIYNILIKLLFQTKFSDAQCGFKAITKKAARQILPEIKDKGWFMDSELLIIAEKSGFNLYEEPVLWIDNPGSTVRVIPTIWGDLRGLFRLLITHPWKKIKKSQSS